MTNLEYCGIGFVYTQLFESERLGRFGCVPGNFAFGIESAGESEYLVVE